MAKNSLVLTDEEKENHELDAEVHPKVTSKKKPAKTTVKRTKKDPAWRPIMFSRNTAMFTIPTEIRDKAKLEEMYYKGLGAVITYNETTKSIEIKLNEARPLPRKVE
jgi:hypothetical protein